LLGKQLKIAGRQKNMSENDATSRVRLGMIVSGLLGGLTAWWLGGGNLLLASVAGLVAAWAFPRAIPATTCSPGPATASRAVTRSAAGNARSPAETTPEPIDTGQPRMAEAPEAELGHLSGLLPKPKLTCTKRGLG
jgi:hypothetical protein